MSFLVTGPDRTIPTGSVLRGSSQPRALDPVPPTPVLPVPLPGRGTVEDPETPSLSSRRPRSSTKTPRRNGTGYPSCLPAHPEGVSSPGTRSREGSTFESSSTLPDTRGYATERCRDEEEKDQWGRSGKETTNWSGMRGGGPDTRRNRASTGRTSTSPGVRRRGCNRKRLSTSWTLLHVPRRPGRGTWTSTRPPSFGGDSSRRGVCDVLTDPGSCLGDNPRSLLLPTGVYRGSLGSPPLGKFTFISFVGSRGSTPPAKSLKSGPRRF